ncbi:MAG: Panacea domain-containing protein, partial [Kiloniellales bacterium]
DVAKYVLRILKRRGETPVTTWKLQKLVYYAQAWSLVWDDEPIFQNRIEAWAGGPVVPDLYQQHRGRFKIADIAGGDWRNLTEDERETVDVVVNHYGQKSAQYLSELTHQERPWREARRGLRPGKRGTREITQDLLADYYGGL